MSEHRVQLASEYSQSLTFESYPAQSHIEGVWVHALKKNRSGNGAFMEYLRLNEAGVQHLPGSLVPRQISVSWADPRRINAFHIHVKEEQNEIWCVLAGRLTIWLVDCRSDSKTQGAKRKFILSGEQPMLLHIPSGVAHGYCAAYEGATLLYSMDAQFNIQDPNEGRLPWDLFGADLWQDDNG
ncbi:dTDP-4-dehydrorhamnose 3,5-epimerase family protein [Deinococcus ficus]|uniref:dTDP-4-dehydrorhamnose 3,5-epimerase family protein n=1 Tax=Deinococcus ficus TaxID=317577 RepID=UPI000A008793|nr:dTDP-4-dehydrorhamnose 3,5-epimerase family protein [Deinococcus ficus]